MKSLLSRKIIVTQSEIFLWNNFFKKENKQLSALVPSPEKPPRHESEVEEEVNAQAEVQKKKDEAEVQVKSYTHGGHRSRNKGSQRPGMLVEIVGLHTYCLELVSVDLEHVWPF